MTHGSVGGLLIGAYGIIKIGWSELFTDGTSYETINCLLIGSLLVSVD